MRVSDLAAIASLGHSIKYIMVLFFYGSIVNLSMVTSLLADTSSSSKPLDTIPVELTTTVGHQQTFVEGEEIQFLLSLGDDAYIYMYHIDATGNIEQILPSTQQSSHFYKKGFFLTIPNYEKVFRFIVTRPYGDETIHVFASDQSLLDINVDTNADKNVASTTIGDIREQIISRSTAAFGEDRFSFTSRPAAAAQPMKEQGIK